MQQQREALMKEKETAGKVAARAFAHGYLSDLVPAVFSNLSSNGFFYDPIQRSAYTLYFKYNVLLLHYRCSNFIHALAYERSTEIAG